MLGTQAPTTETKSSGSETKEQNEALKRGHTAQDLQLLYAEGENADQALFSEMRSNLLLVAGDHYQKKESQFFRRIRDSRELSQEQKLRLTKNHIRKICQTYANQIISSNPNVGFRPKDEKSPHDQKVAELHHSVWLDAFNRYNLDDCIDDWCDNFVQVGEVIVKIFFDPTLGETVGYEQARDEFGSPLVDEMGQPVPDMEREVKAGEFVFEEIIGPNLLRPQNSKDIRKAEWLCNRKSMGLADLLLKYKDQEKQEFLKASVDDSFMVFDAAYGGYQKGNDHVSVREFFFRPCLKYPKGYFYIATREGILEEGELPGGIFPIIIQQFDKIQTTPRGRSPVKQMRPFQAEINRSSSMMAEHQVTIGSDKLLIQNGTKVSASAALPGIRAFSYTGAAPTILEGRTGAQYLEYLNAVISELYAVMNVAEVQEENAANLDPYVLLFRSARQKVKFQRYIKRFEKFLIEIVKTYLKLAKLHLNNDALIYAVGSNEQVNIPEFKKLPDICYEVNIEAQSGDIESKLGQQIVLNHVLQYVGSQLKPEDIGKIMKAMPFANVDESFDDFLIDSDSVKNDILALDRGERPPVNYYDEHPYCIKKLTLRTRQADFKFLPPQVQKNYMDKIHLHEQMEAKKVAEIQRAQQGFIPTAGYLVACDFYVTDPSDKTGLKTRRARLPSSSVEWLIKQLEAQGQMQTELADLNKGNQASMAGIVTQMSQARMARGQGGSAPQGAEGMMYDSGNNSSGPTTGFRP
jgi:hypothetical protein